MPCGCRPAQPRTRAPAKERTSVAATAATVALAVGTLLSTLLVRDGGPFVMPASNPSGDFVGLTVANASSSPYTLEVMTWAAVFSLPLIAAYQIWTYWVFRRRITAAHVEVAH